MGVPKSVFLAHFHALPERPAKGGFVSGNYDFTAINQLLPHPIYAWMGWMCVLNPSESMFEQCKQLLQAAYDKAWQATQKKL